MKTREWQIMIWENQAHLPMKRTERFAMSTSIEIVVLIGVNVLFVFLKCSECSLGKENSMYVAVIRYFDDIGTWSDLTL